MTHPNPMRTFGKYELGPRISLGGMAEVFRAVHTPSGTQVALKRILPEVSEDEEFIKMFEDEARIASQLEHPYIARCLDFGNVDGEWFIAFEYVSGKDLRALFDRATNGKERPPLWFLLYVFARIGEGLAYAHARKTSAGNPVSIVHRDVSPQNIVVSFDGDVKLIDFGIAKATGKLSRTQVGAIKGKFGYMSPEQLSGTGEIDQRSDIFSLGVCMWELLTLQRLFQAENELLVIEKVRTLRVEPPSTYNEKCPPELDRIVLKALAKGPDERYRAAKDVYKDLNYVAASKGGLASREQIAQYMRRAFPEGPMPSGQDDKVHAARQPREMVVMATNDKGSDLDIFEGLGKKGGPSRQSSSPTRSATPPPPPPSRAPDAKRTLLGVSGPGASPTPPPPPAGGAGARTPPPPPGRASLPPVVSPQNRGVTTQPPPAVSKSASTSTSVTSPGVEMDWDDDDEATHIFDKPDDLPFRRAPAPAAGAPAPAPAAAAPVPPAAASSTTSFAPTIAQGAPHAPPPPPPNPTSIPKQKATLLGLTAPLQTPPPPPATPSVRPTPPPPPPPGAFGRSSAPPPPMGLGFPPPPTISPVPQAPQTQQGLGGPAYPRAGSAPPPPPPPISGPPSAGPFARSGAMPQVLPQPMAGYASRPPMRSMEATAVVRPAAARMGRLVVIGLIVAAAVVAGVMLWPQRGRILVNIADAKGASVNRADIFVDGRKQCDTAPCIVEDMTAGSHEVKVLAEGSDTPQLQTVSVEARKDVTAAFTLGSKSGLKVSGTQPGVKLYVDDKELGPLPQDVHDLAAGDHVIKLAGSERYQPLEKHVTIEKDKVEDLGAVTLKVLKGKATISLQTPGARVFLTSGADRRELPMLPISVDIDTTKAWSLQATKTGFADYNQPISFDDGQAEKSFNVTLDSRGQGSAVAAAPAYVAQAPAAAPAPRPVAPAPAPAPAPQANNNSSAAASDGSEGFLNINSIPPSTCILDGHSLGTTPKVHVSVKPGSHTVKFVNADQGLTKTITVTVGNGETKPAVAKLSE